MQSCNGSKGIQQLFNIFNLSEARVFVLFYLKKTR